jgi:NADPH-dependent 2,4-dienoyl-CoA reductase/sulfur reductase-like enzyme
MQVPNDMPTTPPEAPSGTAPDWAAQGAVRQAANRTAYAAAEMAAHQPANGVAHQTDIIVIGGGPAGSSAAIVLAERGHRVV